MKSHFKVISNCSSKLCSAVSLLADLDQSQFEWELCKLQKTYLRAATSSLFRGSGLPNLGMTLYKYTFKTIAVKVVRALTNKEIFLGCIEATKVELDQCQLPLTPEKIFFNWIFINIYYWPSDTLEDFF